MKKLKELIEKNEFLLLILIITVLLRLPGLFEPSRYADEDIYLTIGQGIRRGLILYKEIYDNKPPLIYFLAAMAGSVMWFRLILMFWNLVNVILVYRLSLKLIAKKWGVVLSTFLFSIFSTIPLLEGNIANGEIFMIMPATAAVLLVLSKTGQLKNKKIGYFLLAGILWSIAFLFKAPIAIELFGLLFFILIYQSKTLKDKRLWLLLLGFIIPIVLSGVYFGLVSAGKDYLEAALLNNFSYLSSWEGGRRSILFSGLFQRGVILMLILFLIAGLRPKLGSKFGLMAIWFATALFGALLSGRPYPHYLLEIVAPASILLVLIITRPKVKPLLVGGMLFGMLGFSIYVYKFWYYRSLPYYRNFIEYISGKKDQEDFTNFWGRGVTRNLKVASYVRRITERDDKIFVWGTEPAIYVMSDRLPVGKYTVSYHIIDFDKLAETYELLIREKPRVIIVNEREKYDFPQLKNLLVSGYAPVERFDDMKIYLKLNNREL